MSTFNFNLESIRDSQSIYQSISQSYYPDGQQVVKNTSMSTQMVSRDRTMTTRNLSDAISGDAFFRNPRFALTAYNKLLSSGLNSAITGGSEAAFTNGGVYKTADPESINNQSTLSGGIAFARTMVDSIVGKKLSSDFVKSASASISNDYTTIKSYPASTMGDVDGNHTSPDGMGNGNIVLGGRVVVLGSQISEQELTWLKERAQLLASFNTVSDAGDGLITGFDFDVPNGLEDLHMASTRYPGIQSIDIVPQDLINAPVQKIYAAPVLIEFLIYLNQRIVINGGFGFGRGTSGQGSNLSNLKSGGYLTDHATGRGFDISGIGIKGGEYYDLWNKGPTDADVYRKGLDLLFTTLSAAPQYLLPDFLNISTLLSSELGLAFEEVGQGEDRKSVNRYEQANAAYRIKYPTCQYMNLDADGNHQNHIHVSFNSARAGYYSGPGGQLGGNPIVNDGQANLRNPGATSNNIRLGGDRALELANQTQNSGITLGGDRAQEVQNGGNIPNAPGSQTSWPPGSFLAFVKELRSKNPFTPRGALSPGGTFGSPNYTGDLVIPSDINSPKFTQSYATDRSTALTAAEVFALLRLTIMNDEIAAVFTAISEKESNFRPGSCTISPGSNDWSLGLFQLNGFPTAQGSYAVWLPYPSMKNAFLWQLAYKDWQNEDFGVNLKDGMAKEERAAFKTLVVQRANETDVNERYKFVDPVLFIPINQVYALYNVNAPGEFKGVKLGENPEYRFFNWGDYGGGPPYGCISGTKFATAAQVYMSTGKPLVNLQKWVRDAFATDGAKNSRALPYIEDWTNGWHFPVRWTSDGWVKLDPIPPS